MCVCLPSPFSPPHTRTHISTGWLAFYFRVPAALDMEGRDCTGAHGSHHHVTLIALSIGGRFQNPNPAMCSLCAGGLSNRRIHSEGGGPSENSSSFSFSLPQPEYALAACPPLNTQAAVQERSGTRFLVSHSIKLCIKCQKYPA